MILNLAGKLKRKPSGGKRAWFLEEESEPRNKLVLEMLTSALDIFELCH
jgi:hypothetical protein